MFVCRMFNTLHVPYFRVISDDGQLSAERTDEVRGKHENDV